MQPLTAISCRIESFSFALKSPFQFAGQTIAEREGYYLHLSTQTGLSSIGEASPLLGVSLETLKKTKHDLDQVASLLPTWVIPTDYDALKDFCSTHPILSNSASSVRFCVESALLHLAALQQGKSLDVFMHAPFTQVRSAGLLSGSLDEMLADMDRLLKESVRVFKIKVGSRNIALDVKNVQEIRSRLPMDAKIRLDANRSWRMDEALLFAQLTGPGRIEFIEEPISDMGHVQEFFTSAHIPVALDETLLLSKRGACAPGRCSPTLINSDAVCAYVIKPMVLGGVFSALSWIKEAEQQHKKAIVSSAFESAVGIKALHVIAQFSPETAGLGTINWRADG